VPNRKKLGHRAHEDRDERVEKYPKNTCSTDAGVGRHWEKNRLCTM